ncbi:MAG: LptA/OstA family protein [Pseudomonadota bacterium]|nr:LptA/OstA family protein [Pseudomonadota bacterium]
MTKSFAQEDISFSTSIDSPLKISADNMYLDRSLNKGGLSGKINIVQGPMSLKAQKVEFNLNEKGVLPVLKDLKVLGGVRIENGNNISATGNNAYYSVLQQTVVIEGDVNIDNGFSIIKGDKLILDLVTGKAEIVDDRNVDSRIKGIFKEE